MTDAEISLKRGGRIVETLCCIQKCRKDEGRPTVILAKTVKGYGMGEALKVKISRTK